MKLFLSSIGIAPGQIQEFEKLTGKPAASTNIAYIDNAADTYPVRPAWADDTRIAFQDLGLQVDRINLQAFHTNHRPKSLATLLEKYDVIWAGGGNSFYLRWLLRETGADTVIGDLVKNGKIYGGGSAGAILAGPTLKHFEAADDPADAPEVIWDGLNLTKTVVVPHMDNAKFAAVINQINDNLKADGYTTAPLTDTQALIINGNEQRII